jgi:hypothetical protein
MMIYSIIITPDGNNYYYYYYVGFCWQILLSSFIVYEHYEHHTSNINLKYYSKLLRNILEKMVI